MGTLCIKENTMITLAHSMRVSGSFPSCFDTQMRAKLASVSLEVGHTEQKTYIFLSENEKPTAPGVPRRSPIQVLSWPDDA